MHLHVLMFVNPWIAETHKMWKPSYSTWTVQYSHNNLDARVYCFCKIVRHFISRLGLGTRLCFAVNDSFTKREGKTNGYGRGTKWAWGRVYLQQRYQAAQSIPTDDIQPSLLIGLNIAILYYLYLLFKYIALIILHAIRWCTLAK